MEDDGDGLWRWHNDRNVERFLRLLCLLPQCILKEGFQQHTTTAVPGASTQRSSLRKKIDTIFMRNSSIVGGDVDVDLDGAGGREISTSGGMVELTDRWMLLMATWRRS
jgi:hypothetical protein